MTASKATLTLNRRKIKKYLIPISLLLIGVMFMFLGEKICFSSDLINHGLREIGLFLSVSVVSHLIYTCTIKKDDLDELRHILDEQANFNNNGLHKIHSNFSYTKVFDSLKKGDELLWLWTWVPDFFNYINSFHNALDRGASISLLAINPHSKNALSRGKELDTVYPLGEYFINTIRQTYQSYKLQEQSVHFNVRIYTDLPGTPILLIKKNNKPIVAYTGFYANKRLQEFIFLEWRHNENDSNNSPLSVFHQYFLKKWEDSESLKGYNAWLGKWNYKVVDKHDNKVIAFGSCEFTPGDNGEFKVKNGLRTHKTKKFNEDYVCEFALANWKSSKDFSIERKQDEITSFIFFYEITFKDGSAKGVANLTYNNNTHNITGTYHVYDLPDCNLSNTSDGAIEFTREQLVYSDPIQGEIIIAENIKDYMIDL